MKTVDKLPPSDKHQQFKDGVLWADCVKLLIDDDVVLVSDDKAFYRDRDHSKGPAPNLLQETLSKPYQLRLLPSLAELNAELRLNTEAIEDDSAIADGFLAEHQQRLSSLLEQDSFSLGPLRNTTFRAYVTGDPSKVYIEFELRFELVDTSSDARNHADLSIKGDGTYDVSTRAFSNSRVLEEVLQIPGESPHRRAHGYLESTLGSAIVRHSIREEIQPASKTMLL